MLHCRPKLFAYGGTKDKRGVTVQRVTGYRVNAERLVQAIRGIPTLKVSSCEYVPKAMTLGDLQGNRFTIVLRDCKSHLPSEDRETIIQNACSTLDKVGFINYFGLQRFGSLVPTHVIGKYILQEKYDTTVALLLAPSQNSFEPEHVKKARQYFVDTRDVRGTIRLLPKWMHVESAVLNGLLTNGPNAFLNAIQMIPRNMRMMYVHAYQSYVWNSMASLRLSCLDRTKAVEGDLIFVSKDVIEIHPENDSGGKGHTSSSSDNQTSASTAEEQDSLKAVVRHVTAEEASVRRALV